MLQLLTDANITPKVARAVRASEPTCPITSVHQWQNGAHLRSSDREILLAAAPQGLTLVTRDVSTITELVSTLYREGRSHAGALLVPGRTYPATDIGLLARSLIALWHDEGHLDWLDRTCFLGTPY